MFFDKMIQDVLFDSQAAQFLGSIQNKKGIPLEAENSYAINLGKSMFTKKEIEEFKKKAVQLNANQQGDQATFVLEKCSPQ